MQIFESEFYFFLWKSRKIRRGEEGQHICRRYNKEPRQLNANNGGKNATEGDNYQV